MAETYPGVTSAAGARQTDVWRRAAWLFSQGYSEAQEKAIISKWFPDMRARSLESLYLDLSRGASAARTLENTPNHPNPGAVTRWGGIGGPATYAYSVIVQFAGVRLDAGEGRETEFQTRIIEITSDGQMTSEEIEAAVQMQLEGVYIGAGVPGAKYDYAQVIVHTIQVGAIFRG